MKYEIFVQTEKLTGKCINMFWIYLNLHKTKLIPTV